MGRSVESSRPMLAPSTASRASQRISTYSASPSIAMSDATVTSHASSSDPRVADLKTYTEAVDRMENRRLQDQRYIQSSEQSDDMAKLALQAKVERALGRRMTGQDAVLRPKVMSEKSAVA